MREWHPEQGFPTPKQMARMVAAEVRAQVETAMQREREKAEKAESRRDRPGLQDDAQAPLQEPPGFGGLEGRAARLREDAPRPARGGAQSKTKGTTK